jgi:hypothetical protein
VCHRESTCFYQAIEIDKVKQETTMEFITFAFICIKFSVGVACAIGDSIRKITDQNQPLLLEGEYEAMANDDDVGDTTEVEGLTGVEEDGALIVVGRDSEDVSSVLGYCDTLALNPGLLALPGKGSNVSECIGFGFDGVVGVMSNGITLFGSDTGVANKSGVFCMSSRVAMVLYLVSPQFLGNVNCVYEDVWFAQISCFREILIGRIGVESTSSEGYFFGLGHFSDGKAMHVNETCIFQISALFFDGLVGSLIKRSGAFDLAKTMVQSFMFTMIDSGANKEIALTSGRQQLKYDFQAECSVLKPFFNDIVCGKVFGHSILRDEVGMKLIILYGQDFTLYHGESFQNTSTSKGDISTILPPNVELDMNILDWEEANEVVSVEVDEASPVLSTSAAKLGSVPLIVKFVLVLALFTFQLVGFFRGWTSNFDLKMNNSAPWNFGLADYLDVESLLNWNLDGAGEYGVVSTNSQVIRVRGKSTRDTTQRSLASIVRGAGRELHLVLYMHSSTTFERLDSEDSIVPTDNENEPKMTLLLETGLIFCFEKFCVAADGWLRVCFESAERSSLLMHESIIITATGLNIHIWDFHLQIDSVVKLSERRECVLVLRRPKAIDTEVVSYTLRDLCYQSKPYDSLFILHPPMALVELFRKALFLRIVACSTSDSEELVLHSEPVLMMSLELVSVPSDEVSAMHGLRWLPDSSHSKTLELAAVWCTEETAYIKEVASKWITVVTDPSTRACGGFGTNASFEIGGDSTRSSGTFSMIDFYASKLGHCELEAIRPRFNSKAFSCQSYHAIQAPRTRILSVHQHRIQRTQARIQLPAPRHRLRRTQPRIQPPASCCRLQRTQSIITSTNCSFQFFHSIREAMANARVSLILVLLSFLPIVICKVLASQTLEPSDDHDHLSPCPSLANDVNDIDKPVPVRRFSRLVKELETTLDGSKWVSPTGPHRIGTAA